MVETGAVRQVVLAQGMMSIAGVPERFVQGVGRHLRLSADTLQIVGGFASRDGRLDDATHVLGRAELSGDSLHRAGVAGETGEIALVIRPLSGEESGRILLVLSVEDAGVEPIGFRAEILTPPAVFAILKHDVGSGAAQVLSLSATTSLWVLESQRNVVPDLPVAWHFGWDDDGRHPAPARGLVERLEWRAAPPQETAVDIGRDAEGRETTADQLAAINWSLKQIALVLMFLLIVVALK